MVHVFNRLMACFACLLLAMSLVLAPRAKAGAEGAAQNETGAEPTQESCLNSGSDDDNGDVDDCDAGDDEDDEDDDCGGNEEDEPGDESSECEGSRLDPLGGAYFHYGYDYRLEIPGGGGSTGCTTCGAIGANHYGPGSIGRLPSLGITRVHTPRQETHHLGDSSPSYFGRYSTLSLAVSMNIEEINAEQGVRAVLRIPTSTRLFVQAGDNVIGDVGDGRLGFSSSNMQEVRTYDQPWTVGASGWENTGDLTSEISQIRAAEVLFRSGKRWCFEVFDLDPGAGVDAVARIVRRENASGVGLTFTYALPAPATGTWSGHTPGQLWVIQTLSDDYGRVARFTSMPLGSSDRYVIEKIELPDGREVNYSYYQTEELQDVQHPDGSVSTFGYDVDPVDNNFLRHAIYDTAASAGHRRKTLHVTRPTWTDGATTVTAFANRVAKLVNGDGELVYATWERDFVNNQSTVFAYRGGERLERYLQRGSQILERDYAVAVVQKPDGRLDVENSQWERVDSYSGRNRRMAGNETDNLGRNKTFTRNTTRRIYTEAQYPDQSTSSKVYHPEFNWVMENRDRLGRRVVYTRDEAGRPLTKTVAFGTSDAATETWVYNDWGQPTSYTDANQNETEYFYSTVGNPQVVNGQGYLVKVIEPADIPGGPRAEMTYTYDVSGSPGVPGGAGRLVASTDGLGREAVYSYDERQRLVAVKYDDDSQDRWIYGAAGSGDENIVVQTIDRNGNIEKCEFDGADREVLCTQAYGSEVAVETSTTYLSGTRKVASRAVHGEMTTYDFDGLNRVRLESVQVNGGSDLNTATFYDAGQRRRSSTDPYGRSTFTAYDINDRVARVVTEAFPGAVSLPLANDDRDPAGALLNDAYLFDLSRTADNLTGANAAYLIEDMVYDSEGQMIARLDARGIYHSYSYDQQGRRVASIEDDNPGTLPTQSFEGIAPNSTDSQRLAAIRNAAAGRSTPFLAAKTQTVYDPFGNVIEVRTPRYFDTADAAGHNLARTTMTYTGRNLLNSSTQAPGTLEEATTSYTYFLDKLQDTMADGRGNAWSRLWGVCCKRIMATIDPPADIDGSGVLQRAATITRHDFHGNLTHTGRVENVDSVVFANTPENTTVLTDLPDAETLQEVTARYDARHRPVATTTWLVPLPGVDPDAVPIAGGGQAGDPALEINGVIQGLTTTYVYDDDLTDGQGLDAQHAAAIAAHLPGGFYLAGSDGYAEAMINPENETTVRFVDGAGRTVLTIDPTGDAATVTYDNTTQAPGIGTVLVTTATDPFGAVIQSLTDGAGRMLRGIDEELNTTEYFYDNNSNRVSFRDPVGVGEDCLYDPRNREVECRDTQESADGDVRITAYDANHNVVARTDAKGQIDTCAFDARDRQVSCVDRVSAQTLYTYDENSNLLSITDGEGGVTNYVYDARNLQVATEYPGHGVQVAEVLVGDYNNDGVVGQGDLDLVLLNWGSSTLPAGFYEPALPGGVFDGLIGQNEMDGVLLNWGDSTDVDESASDRVEMAYDGLRRVSTKTDQLNDHCTYVYDLASRLTEKEYRQASDTAAERGGPLLYLPLAGNTADASGLNHQIVMFNLTGQALSYADGPDGAPSSALDLAGRSDTFIMGFNTFIYDPESATAGLWARSAAATWNAEGTFLDHTGAWKLTPIAGTDRVRFEVTQNNGQRHSVEFIPSAGFDITQWHHYLATYHAPGGTIRLYVDGELEAEADLPDLPLNNGGVLLVGTHYFPARVALEGEVSGAVVFGRAIDAEEAETLADTDTQATDELKLPTDTDRYTYDRASRLLTAQSERYDNVVSYSYTEDSLIDTEKLTLLDATGGVDEEYLIDRGYDADDRLTDIVYPGGSSVTRTYTARDQLDVVSRDGQLIADMGYDAAMREDSRALGNGLARSIGYGRQDHLPTSMTVANRPGLSWTSYDYDPNKNLDNAQAGGVMAGYSFTTQQDAEDRLDLWTRTNGESQDWGLSLVGDWNSYAGSQIQTSGGAPVAFSQTREHNAVHELESITDGGTVTPVEHDAKGNISQDDKGNTYTYDFDSQLVEARNSSGTLLGTYTYDALGRRTERTVAATQVTTAYVCLTHGSGMGQVISEYDNGTLARQTTYGTYVDEPLTLHTESGANAGATHWYHLDRQYNVVGLTDASGAVVERYAYTAYGDRAVLAPDGTTRRAESAFGNDRGHQGLWHDGETGLIYNRARYRSVSLGGWMGRDPLGYVDGMNLMEVYGSKPIDSLDPTGLDYFHHRISTSPANDSNKITICWRLIRHVEGNRLNWWLDVVTGGSTGYDTTVASDCQTVCREDAPEIVAQLNRFLSGQAGDLTGLSNANNLGDAYRDSIIELVGAGIGAAGKAAQAARAARAARNAERSPRSPVGARGRLLENGPNQPRRNPPQNINGRDFTGHAVDQMQNRGIPSSVVENTIKHGTSRAGNTPGSTVFSGGGNNVSVVTNPGGSVKTVIP